MSRESGSSRIDLKAGFDELGQFQGVVEVGDHVAVFASSTPMPDYESCTIDKRTVVDFGGPIGPMAPECPPPFEVLLLIDPVKGVEIKSVKKIPQGPKS